MSTWEMIPVLLLMLFGVALCVGVGSVIVVIWRNRGVVGPMGGERLHLFRRPGCWLAVRGQSLASVQSALGLCNPKPCSWLEGLATDEQLFIAPPVRGWILVLGAGLPDPSEDVDACFRFVLEMSRKLGQVQFFSASRVLLHHAWIRAERGRVVRAYAWAGRTLWKQGVRTRAERELEVKCFDYTEPGQASLFNQSEVLSANVEKVPLLAARWSLDPARIEERLLQKQRGVAGEIPRRY